MELSHNNISQKEYLKKYLSKDKGEKKKKKTKVSSSSHVKRSVIIDDDLGLPSNAGIDDEEFNLEYLGDEAPQIAGIIDERPPEIRAKENYGNMNRWKSLDGTEENMFIQNLVGKLSLHSKIKSKQSCDISDRLASMREKNKENDKLSDSEPPRGKKSEEKKNLEKHGSDSDFSSPRRKDKDVKSDTSPSRKSSERKKRRNSSDDSDLSPPRNTKKEIGSGRDLSPPRRDIINGKNTKHARYASNSGSYLSSPRRKDKGYKESEINRRNQKHYRDGSGSDFSPPRSKGRSNSETKSERSRQKNRGSDSDLPPPRRKESNHKLSCKENRKHKKSDSDSDLSPPRKKERYHKLSSKENRKYRKSDSDSDLSPPRKKERDHKLSSKENRKYRKSDSDSDLSPPRKKEQDHKLSSKENRKYRKSDSDSDLSPPRKKEKSNKYKESFSNHRRRKEDESDLSPPRKHRAQDGRKGDSNQSMKLDKTLDGKKAGLQSAKNLKDELKKLRADEDTAFSKMRASVSGQNASAVRRDRKTGKIRDLEKEKQELVEKSAKTIELEKKYAKWGKGLKQIEEAEQRVVDALHEMNKPLARYAGDDDLEKVLKEREREGDPMLEYIRNKQAEAISLDNTGKPRYQGHFMPNRFGIRPGHRWDGVDRSNGYEQKWFERQNAHKAIQEEAYKWSTSDM